MHASFDELLEPLEAASGQSLNGLSRRLCEQAFDDAPGGFRRCTERALSRARTNPVGLLVRMVSDGDHRLAERAERPQLSRFDRALRWAETTGLSYPSEHVGDLLQGEFDLDEEQCAEIRARIDNSLRAASS